MGEEMAPSHGTEDEKGHRQTKEPLASKRTKSFSVASEKGSWHNK